MTKKLIIIIFGIYNKLATFNCIFVFKNANIHRYFFSVNNCFYMKVSANYSKIAIRRGVIF